LEAGGRRERCFGNLLTGLGWAAAPREHDTLTRR
jgi:hypothetical protein